MTVFVPFHRVIHFNKLFVYWKEEGKVFRARTKKGVNGRIFPVKIKSKEEVKECFKHRGDGYEIFKALKKAGLPVYQYSSYKGKRRVLNA